jgi:hypothetical protein
MISPMPGGMTERRFDMLAEVKPESLSLEGPIADALIERLGFDQEILKKLESIDQEVDLAAEGELTIAIPVVNGKGEWWSDTFPSFWVTVEGTVQVQEPPGYTWWVKVRDVIAEKTVFEGLISPGQVVPYSYKTGFRTRLHATVSCGCAVNTTVKVKATYKF